MAHLGWTEEAVNVSGICERGFTVERQGQTIPGVVWYPAAPSGPRPLVLIGHGGSGHKRNERMVMLGRLCAGDYGWYAAAIDGPVHGARGPVTNANDPAYRQMWQRPEVVQDMIDDWRATLDALSTLRDVDTMRVGYWGVSMGTMFGLPYVASDTRVRVAVLGKAGMHGSSVQRSGIDVHFKTFAPQVTIPVLFVMQWDDERFERDGQLDLFDRLGAHDKRLHAYPGQHADNGPEAFDVAAAFLKRYLERAKAYGHTRARAAFGTHRGEAMQIETIKKLGVRPPGTLPGSVAIFHLGPPGANTRKFTVSQNGFLIKDLQRPWITITDAHSVVKDGGTATQASDPIRYKPLFFHVQRSLLMRDVFVTTLAYRKFSPNCAWRAIMLAAELAEHMIKITH